MEVDEIQQVRKPQPYEDNKGEGGKKNGRKHRLDHSGPAPNRTTTDFFETVAAARPSPALPTPVFQ
jgi:hypothetical protein